MKFKLSILKLAIRQLFDDSNQQLLTKIEVLMSALKDEITTLTDAVNAAVQTETALKAKNDDLTADNAKKQSQIDSLNATNLQLQQDIATAIANAADPADIAALRALRQKLVDANTVNNPAN